MIDLEAIKKEYSDILEELGDPELISNWDKLEELSKRKEVLEKMLETEREMKEIENKMEESKSIISAGEDPELAQLAETEIAQLAKKKEDLKSELEKLSAEPAPREGSKAAKAIIVEIRAGAGGEEAALFAGDLYRMYSRYAQIQGWKQKTLESNSTEIGGFKQIIFELKNGDVFSKMQYEGGVHRVQRVPSTEKSDRIHTSTASVAILPIPKKTEIKIRPDDLRTDYYHSSGHGGQYVNKRMTAVRITHIPTGIVVTCQTERSLQQNKESALSLLSARIFEKKEMEEIGNLGEKRKAQIGWAKRAEKIRTYNFPQDRVTDHRIKKSWHDIEGIMEGKLDAIVETLQKTSF